MEIKDLKPELVWKFFSELSEIPRGSGDEKAVSDYLVNFAKERNLDVRQDEALNVIFKKDATAGYEDKETVALQGHMDMVCVKEDDSDHDFSKDPIKLLIDGDWVTADGTTLGADDGMGVALILAIFDDEKVEHGPLEAIITTGEETSMVGANALDASDINAKYLVNIDTEDDGILTVGCAGGCDLEISFKKEKEASQGEFLKLDLRGFEGGHSGMEIDKGRLNAIKTLGRLLVDIEGLQIAELNGGVKRNAIAATSQAVFAVANKDKAKEIIEQRIADILNESKDTDPNGQIKLEDASFDGEVLTAELSKNIANTLYTIPDGLVKKYNGEIITSSNIGVLEEDDNEVKFSCMARSQIDSAKFNRAAIVEKIARQFGADCKQLNSYTGWQREETKLIDIANDIWKEQTGSEMTIETTHGGLECGLFKGIMPDVEMLSFGPTILGAHSPSEKVSIESVEKNYKFLIELLKRI
ncbi:MULTISPECIES: beta-Ala-His dipeptidase [Anaerococcus]|uniref:Cytosol non-specific dipeptidase n=1 Tax=Anaerococcus octavius TaxID=54007 RepID=A0A380WY89_9FIRM|nr:MULTISPECIES: beta-Ala-His dipeptidase [Anaerococcus]MDU0893846.1 beta-Ala-His dipeptidase [Anaerococcus sp.]MDU3177081.1 beta-Ala-His dipeptidase [Anaerococcus sp.]MDU5534560.1 beta-Ala-His dipeptidase [Anaerococcus sp.]SUU93132.1 Cytosol non-specific dipeptidase [Anaerococcus octavius]